MKIHTYQISKWRKAKAMVGVKVLDTTVKTGLKALSPTWDMVLAYKQGLLSEAEYTEQYIEIIENSKLQYPKFWKLLESQEHVAFGCYCRPGDFCHRLLLKDILLGMNQESTYLGEIV